MALSDVYSYATTHAHDWSHFCNSVAESADLPEDVIGKHDCLAFRQSNAVVNARALAASCVGLYTDAKES